MTHDNFRMKIGDTVTMPVPIYRRWWQLWRPRIIGYRDQRFTIVSQFTSDGVWNRAKIERI